MSPDPRPHRGVGVTDRAVDTESPAGITCRNHPVAEGVAIMSYPPVRFDGPAGAGTAAFRPRDTPPDLTMARGFVDFLATDRTTAG